MLCDPWAPKSKLRINGPPYGNTLKKWIRDPIQENNDSPLICQPPPGNYLLNIPQEIYHGRVWNYFGKLLVGKNGDDEPLEKNTSQIDSIWTPPFSVSWTILMEQSDISKRIEHFSSNN